MVNNCCNFDTIIFGIANSSPEDCANNYEAAYMLNVISTIKAINLFLEAGVRVLFLSSDAADLSCGSLIGHYASMKSEVEHRFQDHKLFKCIRLSYVYSMRDRFTQYLYYCANNDNTAEIYDPFYRNIIHISDVAEALWIIVNNWDLCSKGCYNLYGSISMSRVDMAKIFQSYIPELKFEIIAVPESFSAHRALSICPELSDTEFLMSRKPKEYSSIFTEGA
jgi:dTDP-4-dehydrorhamnose reductase